MVWQAGNDAVGISTSRITTSCGCSCGTSRMAAITSNTSRGSLGRVRGAMRTIGRVCGPSCRRTGCRLRQGHREIHSLKGDSYHSAFNDLARTYAIKSLKSSSAFALLCLLQVFSGKVVRSGREDRLADAVGMTGANASAGDCGAADDGRDFSTRRRSCSMSSSRRIGRSRSGSRTSAAARCTATSVT